MDPRKLQHILELCEKIQEVSASVYEEIGEIIEEHKDLVPDPDKMGEVPLQFMVPELVAMGQIAPATKPATDEQIQLITQQRVWERYMAESLYSAAPDMLICVGGLKELVNRLDSITQILLYKDLDGND